MKLTTKGIALMAIFAALYYAASLISPFIPAVAIPEITIKLEALLASVFGVLLGPYLGFLTSFLGALIAWVLPPSSGSVYGLPFLLAPPLNALVVGFIFYKKWKYAFVVLALEILAFWFTPPTQPLSEFWYIGLAVTWDKIIALALIFPVVRLAKFKSVKFLWMTISPEKLQPLFYFLLAFIGNQADNMWGSTIFAIPTVYEQIFGIYSLDTMRFLFVVSPLVYPAIRIIQAIIAMIIIVPLVKALESSTIIPLKESIAA
jgi:hypothetical protein